MSYKQALEKIETTLTNTKFGVLATVNKDGVPSASQMCIVNIGLKVYFQTDITFEKVQNIKENPNVAINVGSMYFKGIARLVGHPVSSPVFIQKIKEKHKETYNSYTNLPNEVLIEVDLVECKIWGIDNGKSIHNQEAIQVIDLKKKTIKAMFIKKCKEELL